jgi:hypothetical protein
VEKQTAVKLYSLAVIRGLQSASYAISIPFLSIYLYNVRGVPMSLVGTIIGFASILGSFLRFYAGKLSDTLPTDTVMKLGLFFRATGFSGFSILILLRRIHFCFSFSFYSIPVEPAFLCLPPMSLWRKISMSQIDLLPTA